MNPCTRLLAENLDNLPRVPARLAERDPAVLSQLELLALQHHLQLAVDGDEGAVRAVVPQHELVLAPLDSAMLSRSEEHTSELQSQSNLVCRLLLEKKKGNL